MTVRTWLTGHHVRIAAAVVFGCVVVQPVHAQRDSIPPGYPQSLQHDRDVMVAAGVPDSADPARLVTLAAISMNMGDDLLEDPDERRRAYEEGARMAQRALEIQASHVEAHFLYAANLGSAAQVKGITSAMFTINEIKAHLRRALELRPDHAPSLQFMGGLMAELPWFLGGDDQAAQEYLQRAVAADANYTNARIILAKLLIAQNNIDGAKEQLRAVVEAERPHDPYTWQRKCRPEAQRLLDALSHGSRTTK